MSAPAAQEAIISKLEVCINVRDKQAAKAWYAATLDIQFDARDRAEVGGVTVVLYQFVTDDLARSHAALLARGAPVTAINPECLNFGLVDPDGNRLVFYQPADAAMGR